MKKIILFLVVSFFTFVACSSSSSDNLKFNEEHASYQAMCKECLASGGTWQGPNACTKNCDLMDTYCYVDSCPGECDSETCDCLTAESCKNAGCDFFTEGETAWC